MKIGRPLETFEIEPLREPFAEPLPETVPEHVPAEQPVEEPVPVAPGTGRAVTSR